ncbi:fasciculation and elongation protein zeta-1 [Callorhinchus milii]|uniref:Fasciculation and elongation protein zeta 1 (zygin I) n=1 Tax=Callorhinchus milii TaxID=7868 RepID=V9KS51_CALMI|nr:fasciculation and elongation protein zeta-1 [Callorhinchus milii]|eukprot:gi/632956952/ref/XP_007894216.1/ PREDICTED: fasciculation and elongation protein zeta-1 [Callorhinchus milii]
MAAPLVTLDEEWQDFYEVKEWSPGQGQGQGYGCGCGPGQGVDSENLNELNLGSGRVGFGEELGEMDNFTSEMMSFKSMEDLVHDFDEKLNVCFHNYNQKTEVLAPVKQQMSVTKQQEDRDRDPQEDLIRDDEIWDALTDNYVTSGCEDWRVARLQELNMNLTNMESIDKEAITEEGELIEKIDFIVSSTSDEPLFTADQVIEEIEEMMQNSPDPDEEEEEEEEVTSQSDKLSVCSQEETEVKMTQSSSPADDVRQMPEAGLRGLLEEIEGETRGYSEELIQQLALRDELEFEKEVKNSFISVLIEVQNKQKEQRESLKRKKKEKGGSPQSSRPERGNHMPIKRFSMEGISSVIQSGIRQTFGNSGSDRQYLTTVIPYEKKGVPPTVEDLQILTTILLAMKEESEKVPVLLTDYILKVLCPT